MKKYEIGTKVTLLGYEGVYEVIASKYAPLKYHDGDSLPVGDSEYTFKRIDGVMEGNFEPYLNLQGSLIDEVID